MQEEILKRLDGLAAGLGVTVDKMWDVLVKQCYVEGTHSFMIGMILAISIYVLYIKGKSIIKWIDENDLEPIYVGIGVYVFFAPIVIFACSCDVFQMINPEYYALDKIMDVLKPAG
jgi:hypothetical protein